MLKLSKMAFQNIPKWIQNSSRTIPNHAQKTRHHTPRQPRHDTHLHSGHGVEKCAPRPPAARPPWRAFFYPMAAVEVCVVVSLAWGVVAGLFGVVWGGSGAVLNPFGDVLEGPFGIILICFRPD